MKKSVNYVFAIAFALLFVNCGSGSSGTAMLDLDVRIIPYERTTESLEREGTPEKRQYVDDFLNLFTVLPGPYEFTWEELKNQDSGVGNESCSTKLKMKLRLNKTLKLHGIDEEKAMEEIRRAYQYLEMFNSEGKTFLNLMDENDSEHAMLLLRPSLYDIWGVDGKLGRKDNTGGLRDFYHFMTSKPGTEFDLVVDCGIQHCKEIKDQLEYTKGLYIKVNVPEASQLYAYRMFRIE